MMHKLEIDLKGYPQTIIGKETPSIIVDGYPLNDVAGFEVNARAGECARASIDIYIRDLKVSADAEILINAIPVSENIGFKILQSLLEYFLPQYGYTEKIKSIITNHQF